MLWGAHHERVAGSARSRPSEEDLDPGARARFIFSGNGSCRHIDACKESVQTAFSSEKVNVRGLPDRHRTREPAHVYFLARERCL